MKLLLLAVLLSFALSGCVKKPGEAHFEDCAQQIRFRGPQKPEIGFGETPDTIAYARFYSESFKMLWDQAANDFLKFDQKEPKAFCQVSGETVVFIAYVPDAFLIRKDNLERMCWVGWAAVEEVRKRRPLRFKKAYVVLRGPGMYGPLISGGPGDKEAAVDRDRNALDAVYPYFIGKK